MDGRRTYVWNAGGKMLTKEDRSIWTETHPSSIPAKNPIQTDLGSNLGLETRFIVGFHK